MVYSKKWGTWINFNNPIPLSFDLTADHSLIYSVPGYFGQMSLFQNCLCNKKKKKIKSELKELVYSISDD